MKIGDRVFVRGYIDEIRKDTVIIRNAGGYFGTIPSEVITGELPSAQPQRKTGRWIHDGYAFKGGIDWMHCSECGHKDSWSAATRTPFCAWCGARMEEPEDISMEYFENGGR